MIASSDWWKTGLVEAGALLLAAGIGAWLGARLTKNQSIELHRIERRQDALLRLLDHLSVIRLEVEKSLADDPPQSIIWVPAAEDVAAKMVRQIPGAETWDFSDEPDKERAQWGRIAVAIHEAERNFREHLGARINDRAVADEWNAISDVGFRLAMSGAAGQRQAAERLRSMIAGLMDRARALE